MDRRSCLKLGLISALGLSLVNCQLRKPPPVRVVAHTWPGYEFLFLARNLAILDPHLVRIIETPNATTNIRALGAHMAEGAVLTLDEVITAREGGIDLTVVAVLDVSMGADALLVRKDIQHLSQIKGLRIGVEHTATGAVMLDASLKAAGLQPSDIEIVYLSIDEHLEAYETGAVDILVSFEPVKTNLIKRGMQPLFTSRDISGNIVDVLAFRSDTIASHHIAIQHAIDGHFRALEQWRAQTETHNRFLAKQLNVNEAEVVAIYAELDLPGKAENLQWLDGKEPRLLKTAQDLSISMLNSGLLSKTPNFDRLFDGRFVRDK
jgi:NitT/TauT family transport system substrate-binding protein